MKKSLFAISAIIFMGTNAAFCVPESVSPELEQALKTNHSEPGIMAVLFALLIVIFLIYITGVIYSKLNIAGAKAVQQQLKDYELNKAVVISTTQLGQNKNLHVIELNNKRYLIGAGQDNITLLKELETEESSVEEQTSKPEEEIDNFDIHKKYL